METDVRNENGISYAMMLIGLVLRLIRTSARGSGVEFRSQQAGNATSIYLVVVYCRYALRYYYCLL